MHDLAHFFFGALAGLVAVSVFDSNRKIHRILDKMAKDSPIVEPAPASRFPDADSADTSWSTMLDCHTGSPQMAASEHFLATKMNEANIRLQQLRDRGVTDTSQAYQEFLHYSNAVFALHLLNSRHA